MGGRAPGAPPPRSANGYKAKNMNFFQVDTLTFPTNQRVFIANGGHLNASQWARKSQNYPINSWCIFLKIFVDKVPYILNIL